MGRFKHILIWKLLRFPVKLFLWIRLNYTCKPAPKISGPFLLIANHVTDFDPLMAGCSFGQQMHFVASEHLFRKGFISKLLVWLVAPIARIKGSTDTVSAMAIIRTLRRGANVGLFAEGDRSWNGRTGRLHPTTARLIRATKAALVTYKITGGYLTSPRWSAGLRRGRMYGRMVNVYPPEVLAGMTESEITDAVLRDIDVDAYEAQRVQRIAFRGKNLAESLEKALYTCPSCLGVSTMRSSGDAFYCGCGLRVGYDAHGFFTGAGRPFDTVAQWDAWQERFLRGYAASAGPGPIYEDGGQSLWRIGCDHSASLVAEGILRLYKDRLSLGDFSVGLDAVYHLSVYGAQTIVFSAGGANYEIRSAVGRSGRKYLTMYEILTAMAAANAGSAAGI